MTFFRDLSHLTKRSSRWHTLLIAGIRRLVWACFHSFSDRYSAQSIRDKTGPLLHYTGAVPSPYCIDNLRALNQLDQQALLGTDWKQLFCLTILGDNGIVLYRYPSPPQE